MNAIHICRSMNTRVCVCAVAQPNTYHYYYRHHSTSLCPCLLVKRKWKINQNYVKHQILCKNSTHMNYIYTSIITSIIIIITIVIIIIIIGIDKWKIQTIARSEMAFCGCKRKESEIERNVSHWPRRGKCQFVRTCVRIQQ